MCPSVATDGKLPGGFFHLRVRVLVAGGRSAWAGDPSQFMHNASEWREQAHEGQTLACFPWFIIKFALSLISMAL